MSARFIGPLTTPALPEQPLFEPWCILWTAYDVPRIWDIVSNEDDQHGWVQVHGFDSHAQLLEDQARRMLTQREAIANAWTGPASLAMLSRMDTFITALMSDSLCAATTARGLHGVMETLANAKSEVSKLERKWGEVTTDWKPEWWDHAAADLNRQAQQVMTDADAAIRDHRTNIIIPRLVKVGMDHSVLPDQGSDDHAGLSSSSRHTEGQVPPVPGHQTSTGAHGTSTGTHESNDDGEGSLSGGPATVPAVPGAPISLLPIPPGHSLAPAGGAYVLPGPGVGAGGYVVARPGAGYAGGVYHPGSTRSAISGPGGGQGMYPAPMPMGGPQSRSDSSSSHQRGGDTVWHVRQGVPPIIEPDVDPASTDDGSLQKGFKDWFTDLATPWRRETTPKVTLRRSA